MQKSGSELQDQRVVIMAPFGRDGPMIQKELLAAGIAAEVCQTIEEVAQAISEGAGAALIADEALRKDAVECLRLELAKQPPWSDFPLLVMTSRGEATQASRYRLELLAPLGNVSLLERPLRAETLISGVRAALRARRRQYEIAVHLTERGTTQRELERRNEDLVKANRELEEFAYVASHDLQEPLRMVNIYAELLIKNSHCESPEAEKFADYIHLGIHRMEKLLRDLLMFSRTIHADSVVVNSVDLSAALAQALLTLQERIQESHARIEAGDLPRVRGDESQLAHVFQNLISNALKYRKKDASPEIAISARREGENWVISIADKGIGFEQQYAERIFGLFKRLHKDEYPGTGLGLAICQRIIERCGGKIWAEGRLDEGATFFFALAAAV